MKCKYCNSINDSDAVFCKKCGNSLLENDIDRKNNKDKKNKSKTKNKTKNKVRKVTKVKTKKVKERNNNRKNNNTTINKGSPFKTFVIILLFLIIISLCGVILYFYYEKQNIEVPNLIGLSYDEAHIKLAESNLKIEKKERLVDDIEDEGVVINQSKKAYSKTSENSKVIVTIGVMKEYSVPNFINKNIEDVKSNLDNNKIKYKIIIKDVTVGKSNIVLSQSYKPGSKIKINQLITLTVSNKIENTKNSENSKIIDEEEKEDDEEMEE